MKAIQEKFEEVGEWKATAYLSQPSTASLLRGRVHYICQELTSSRPPRPMGVASEGWLLLTAFGPMLLHLALCEMNLTHDRFGYGQGASM